MLAQSYAWLEAIKGVVARDASWRRTSPLWVWHQQMSKTRDHVQSWEWAGSTFDHRPCEDGGSDSLKSLSQARRETSARTVIMGWSLVVGMIR